MELLHPATRVLHERHVMKQRRLQLARLGTLERLAGSQAIERCLDF